MMDFDDQQPMSDEPLPQESYGVPAGWLLDALNGGADLPVEEVEIIHESYGVPAGWLLAALYGEADSFAEENVIAQEADAISVDEPLPEAVVVPKEVEPRWRILARMLYGGTSDEILHERLSDIDRAIKDDPEAPINYVLRGEALLEAREYALAHAAFQQGLDLAVAQVERNDWGIVAQAVQDRALQGLTRTSKRLTN